MFFNPQTYSIIDKPFEPFIDVNEIWSILNNSIATKERVLEIIQKSLSKQRLNLKEVAVLINADSPELIELIKNGARTLKHNIYGNRIVLFAPIYIGNKCSNNCLYCGFRSSNISAKRTTLNDSEIINEITALEDNGHKRLILVYGEHAEYTPEFIAHSVKLAYSIKHNNGEIRRVNINAAPLDIQGFKIVKESGIGTYQVFQETYHPNVYSKYHKSGKKADYNYRLTALDRAQEAGLDDVGIGALFGLYDWRFEVMGLVRHVNHLEACYNVGPHTISFPRITEASNNDVSSEYKVSDSEFSRLIAILRLSVPYTGMILTARESAELRNELMQFGVSQIDGGTRIEIGAYSNKEYNKQDILGEQFYINDQRSLNEIIDELIQQDMLPSFCTACYRNGRTGQHFMEFSVPGFIKNFCTPNAILTLAEYICDYAMVDTKIKAWSLIDKNINELQNLKIKSEVIDRIELIKEGKRDLYF